MERALRMSVKGQKKSDPVVEPADSVEDFTERVLMSMVFDISQLHESVVRLKVQVYTLAKERGIDTPPD